MVDQIFLNYPATQEDISKVNQRLNDPWDPQDEIVNLWEGTDHTLCEKAEMQNMPGLVYLPGEYIHYAYNMYGYFQHRNVHLSMCRMGSKRPSGTWAATKAQLEQYFNAKYRVYKAKQKSKAVTGITNNVVLQQNQQHHQDAIVVLQQRNAQLAADLAALQARNHHDNGTVISGISDMSELKIQ